VRAPGQLVVRWLEPGAAGPVGMGIHVAERARAHLGVALAHAKGAHDRHGLDASAEYDPRR